MAPLMSTQLPHRFCVSSAWGYYGTGLFFTVTSIERVCHIDDFSAHPKEPSCLGEGHKGLKAIMYFSPFTHITHSPPQHPSCRVSVQKGAWSSGPVCFNCSEGNDNPDSNKKITSLFKELHIFSAYFRSTGKITHSSTFQAYHAKRIKRELLLILVPRQQSIMAWIHKGIQNSKSH